MADVSEDHGTVKTQKGDIATINNLDKDLDKINSIKSKDTENNEIAVRFDSSLPAAKDTFQGLHDQYSIGLKDLDNEKLPPVPDGGWGWVVVVAAFLVSACIDGLAFSFGLLQEEFTQYFKTTQAKTSLIGSLFIASPLLAGPVMSALVNRFHCRIMTMIAAALSTVGFLLAAISNSVEMLCLTFGLLSGLAMGILYVTAVVSVPFWFDKKRNLAISLACCGFGFGTMVYSPMTHYFLEIYDWRNTLVLLAGTLLNICVCGALMAEPEWLKIKRKRDKMLSRSKQPSSASSVSSQDELKSLLKNDNNPECILDTLIASIAEARKLKATTQFNAERSFRSQSHIHLPTFLQNEKVPAEVIEKLMTDKRLNNIIIQNYPDLITCRRSEANINAQKRTVGSVNQPASLPLTIKAKTENSQSIDISATNQRADNSSKLEQPSSNKVALEHQTSWFAKISADCLRDMPLDRSTVPHRGAMLTIPRYKLQASSLPDIYRNSTWSLDSESDDEYKWYHRFWQTFKPTFDFRIFTAFHFLMFNLSSLILSAWFIVPYFFLQSYMSSRNIEGGPVMISIIGVTNSIGIVALGWAGDQPWINVTKTYAICLFICGGSVAAYPLFITSFWSLTVISAIFGISFASCAAYTPAILMELMPIDKFTMAYGFILLSEGIGHLIGPPIGGMLYDLTGTWDWTFYLGGVWLAISGLCVAVIAYTKDGKRLYGTVKQLKDAEEAKKIDVGNENV